MIFGCVCSKCNKWHSHVYENKEGKFICINCKYKPEVEDGRKRNN